MIRAVLHHAGRRNICVIRRCDSGKKTPWQARCIVTAHRLLFARAIGYSDVSQSVSFTQPGYSDVSQSVSQSVLLNQATLTCGQSTTISGRNDRGKTSAYRTAVSHRHDHRS